MNYGVRLGSEEAVKDFITKLAMEAAKRLAVGGASPQLHGVGLVPLPPPTAPAIPLGAHCVTLHLMKRIPDSVTSKFLGHGPCDSFSRSTTLPFPLTAGQDIAAHAVELYVRLGVAPVDVRGLGVHLSKLAPVVAGRQIPKLLRTRSLVGGETGSAPKRAKEAEEPVVLSIPETDSSEGEAGLESGEEAHGMGEEMEEEEGAEGVAIPVPPPSPSPSPARRVAGSARPPRAIAAPVPLHAVDFDGYDCGPFPDLCDSVHEWLIARAAAPAVLADVAFLSRFGCWLVGRPFPVSPVRPCVW